MKNKPFIWRVLGLSLLLGMSSGAYAQVETKLLTSDGTVFDDLVTLRFFHTEGRDIVACPFGLRQAPDALHHGGHEEYVRDAMTFD